MPTLIKPSLQCTRPTAPNRFLIMEGQEREPEVLAIMELLPAEANGAAILLARGADEPMTRIEVASLAAALDVAHAISLLGAREDDAVAVLDLDDVLDCAERYERGVAAYVEGAAPEEMAFRAAERLGNIGGFNEVLIDIRVERAVSVAAVNRGFGLLLEQEGLLQDAHVTLGWGGPPLGGARSSLLVVGLR